ncbi:MAG TPA: DUF2953 domain-containing protein [Romboutsia sp.]|nr:DUF2953 domain-containing protein [Romboutsia sp.]
MILIVLAIMIIKSALNIVLTVYINNSDINVNFNIKYLFNLINIKIKIYPKSKKNPAINKTKRENINKGINKKAIEIEDFKVIYKLMKKIKIQEVYSDVSFGNENLGFTCFIYVFINSIYGNIINIISPEKMYLKVKPDFIKNYIVSNIKIHIKLTIKDIISIFIAILKIYKKIKIKKKDGGKSEISRVNTKSYGDNI